MKKFMDKDFLLETKTAQKLFEACKNEPLWDYHCHLIPAQIAENKKFKNLTEIWLGKGLVPEGTVTFIQLILIYLMIEAISYTMVTAMLSTGDIRDYQILVGGLQLLNLPVDWLLLKAGAPAYIIFVVASAVAVLCLAARLFMLRKMIGLPLGRFLREVLLRELLVVGLAALLPFFISRFMEPSWGAFLLSFAATEIWSIALIWLLGLEHDEKDILLHKIVRR